MLLNACKTFFAISMLQNPTVTCSIQVKHLKEEKKVKVQLKMQLHNFNPNLQLRSGL